MNQAQEVFDAAVKAEEAGLSAKALSLYKKASSIDPKAYHAWLRWAALLYHEGRSKDAITVARKLTKRQPRSYLAHSLIGSSYVELGRWSMAERAFRRSLTIKQVPATWVFLSHVLGRLDRNVECEECLHKALEIDPEYEEAHYNLGCIYRLQGKLTLAEKHFRRAIKIDPKYAAAYAELGFLLLKAGNLKEAVKVLRKSVRYDPNYGWSRLYLANALWTLRRLKAADEQYRKAIELWPDAALTHWCYGDFLSCEGKDISNAERHLRKAHELEPNDELANYYLGKHLAHWGRPQEAKRFLRKSARQGNPQAQELLKILHPLQASSLSKIK